jgi:LysM repeat protein
MNRLSKHRIMAGLCFIFILLVSGLSAQAQSPNLLTNPGFEAPYVDEGGDPPRQVAQGWTAWNLPPADDAPTYQNQQPEYLPTAPDTSRIHGGSNAQLYTSFFATHTAGVYQQVSGVTPGDELTFSLFGYVWSSAFDDPDVSQQDGGVVLQVGIDPTGGTDPTSGSIVWSAASQHYDVYTQYTVTATAADSTVTAFVRSAVSFPTKNNNVYLDDASLSAGGADEPAATNTSIAAAPTFTSTSAPAAASPTATQVTDGGIVGAETSTAAPTEIVAPTFTSTAEQAAATSTSTEAAAAPQSTQTATATVPAAATIDSTIFKGTIVHTVQPGDTVARLAALYGSTAEAIIQANGLNANALINVGQGLVIPVRLAPPVPQNSDAGGQPTAASGQPTVAVNATAVPAATQTPVPTTTVYVVQPDDTLGRIAVRFNTTVAALAQLNGIVNPDRIDVSQRLNIPVPGAPTPTPAAQSAATATSTPPTPTTYVVQPGDNLYRLSVRFGISMSRLVQLNGITDPSLLFVGQRLIVQ